ncbi:MAG: hypothetical protein SH809_12995 [Rhodothermales bacterium]|nr:hypothetical protein [Rhodothermales bacterium]
MKILIAVVASLAFFALGLIGTYMAMPALAPKIVEESTARLDSLDRIDRHESLDLVHNPPDPMPMPVALRDSLGNVLVDSLGNLLLDSTAFAFPASMDPSLDTVIAALRDSLQDIHFRLSIEQETQKLLQQRIGEMEARWEVLQQRFDEARQMSGTLVKLEDGELGALLGKLDMGVIEAIYLEASARNRTRLLQMLPAEKASILVNKLASPQPTLAEQTSQATTPVN